MQQKHHETWLRDTRRKSEPLPEGNEVVVCDGDKRFGLGPYDQQKTHLIGLQGERRKVFSEREFGRDDERIVADIINQAWSQLMSAYFVALLYGTDISLTCKTNHKQYGIWQQKKLNKLSQKWDLIHTGEPRVRNDLFQTKPICRVHVKHFLK